MADVRLVDLDVIKRYSLVVRRDAVPAEELLEALDASRQTVLSAMDPGATGATARPGRAGGRAASNNRAGGRAATTNRAGGRAAGTRRAEGRTAAPKRAAAKRAGERAK